jgi:hypothetical protein
LPPSTSGSTSRPEIMSDFKALTLNPVLSPSPGRLNRPALLGNMY